MPALLHALVPLCCNVQRRFLSYTTGEFLRTFRQKGDAPQKGSF